MSWLPLNKSPNIAVIADHDAGIVPVSKLESSQRLLQTVRDDHADGIVPVNEFPSSRSHTSEVNVLSASGSVPCKLHDESSRYLMLPSGPLQVTP